MSLPLGSSFQNMRRDLTTEYTGISGCILRRCSCTEAETHSLPCVALLPKIHALHPLKIDEKTEKNIKGQMQPTNCEFKGNFRNVHASARSINSPLSAETTFPNYFELSGHFAQEVNSNSSRARSSAKAVAASTLPHVMQQVSNDMVKRVDRMYCNVMSTNIQNEDSNDALKHQCPMIMSTRFEELAEIGSKRLSSSALFMDVLSTSRIFSSRRRCPFATMQQFCCNTMLSSCKRLQLSNQY